MNRLLRALGALASTLLFLLLALHLLRPGHNVFADDFHIFRELQRAVEPADTSWVGFHEQAGRRLVYSVAQPQADPIALAKKLQLAETLLLLVEDDQRQATTVRPPEPPTTHTPVWVWLVNGSLLLLFYRLHPFGTLWRCWQTRRLASSQRGLLVAVLLLSLALADLLPDWFSSLAIQQKMLGQVPRPHRVFRIWRGSHQGLVVGLYQDVPAGLEERLSRALSLGPGDRLRVVRLLEPAPKEFPYLTLMVLAGVLLLRRATRKTGTPT